LKKALAGKQNQITIPSTQNLPSQLIQGILCGGNLSILYSLLGSRDQLNTDGKILFIEEIDEYIYHVERMLYGLKRAGMLTNLKALLIGGMTDLKDHDIPLGKTYQQIILDLTAEYDYPIIFDVPAGHVEDHRALNFGSEVEIKILEEVIEINS
jgi:muramoyltetrapeptide carboxypeptidase